MSLRDAREFVAELLHAAAVRLQPAPVETPRPAGLYEVQTTLWMAGTDQPPVTTTRLVQLPEQTP